jgi:hypothetical protein
MKCLDFSKEEHDVMEEALQRYLSDLRMEISSTDSFDFRKDLKHEADVLRKVLGSLSETEGEIREFVGEEYAETV